MGLRSSSTLFARFLVFGAELDVVTRREFLSDDLWQAWVVGSDPSEVYEWQALLDTLEEARDRFTMLELGAGYGRWTIRAAAAIRRHRPELRYRLIAVEADPVHFRWLKRHTRDNRLRRWSRAGTCRLINAAVSGRLSRHEAFFTGDQASWYGQTLVRPDNAGWQGPSVPVKTVRLSELLRPLEHVDLIDLDVQGAELEVLSEAQRLLGRVRRIYVETHSDTIDEQLARVFADAEGKWSQLVAIPLGSQHRTPLGEGTFDGGGVQVWRNEPPTTAHRSTR